MGYEWQVALGAVFVSGVLFVTLSLLPVRRWIIDAIPRGQKLAISAGIGLFLDRDGGGHAAGDLVSDQLHRERRGGVARAAAPV